MAQGKLKLVVLQKEEPVWTQVEVLTSVRQELNTEYINFNYNYLIPFSITPGQVFYQEGLVSDPSQTYIKVYSVNAQNISSVAGTIELRIDSNGKATQLDKSVLFDIGLNNLNVSIDFNSRPDTLDFTKTATNYLSPIVISKSDILNHFSDFDGSAVVNFGVECGTITNFKYGGVTYVSGTMLPIATMDSVGFTYEPDPNPLGYTEEYPWLIQDVTGLITKA